MMRWQQDYDEATHDLKSGQVTLYVGLGLLAGGGILLPVGYSYFDKGWEDAITGVFYVGIGYCLLGAGTVVGTIGGIKTGVRYSRVQELEKRKPTVGFYIAPNGGGICGTF